MADDADGNAPEAPAANNRIQQQIKDNIVNLPIFYGRPEKDTVTLKYFVSRIDQGVRTLGWTHTDPYMYFAKANKSTAANWVDHYVYCNPDEAHEWNLIKPHFQEAFCDKTDPHGVWSQTFKF